MPRAKSDTAKSSAELDAEIEEMKKKIDEKKKAARAAKNREKAEAERVRAIEEMEFNKRFVEVAKEILLCNCPNDERTIYQYVYEVISHSDSPEPVQAEEDNGDDAPPEPVQVPDDSGQHTDPMDMSLLRPLGTYTG